jgi:hypothetical protein
VVHTTLRAYEQHVAKARYARRICFPHEPRLLRAQPAAAQEAARSSDLELELMLGGSIRSTATAATSPRTSRQAGSSRPRCSSSRACSRGDGENGSLTALEFTNSLHTLDPDVVIICGDRFEQLAIAMAAAYRRRSPTSRAAM